MGDFDSVPESVLAQILEIFKNYKSNSNSVCDRTIVDNFVKINEARIIQAKDVKTGLVSLSQEMVREIVTY